MYGLTYLNICQNDHWKFGALSPWKIKCMLIPHGFSSYMSFWNCPLKRGNYSLTVHTIGSKLNQQQTIDYI